MLTSCSTMDPMNRLSSIHSVPRTPPAAHCSKPPPCLTGLREWNSGKPDNVCFTTRDFWPRSSLAAPKNLLNQSQGGLNEFVIHDESGLFWIAFWIQLRWKNHAFRGHEITRCHWWYIFMTWNMKAQAVSQLETTPSMLFSRSNPNSLKISALQMCSALAC